MNCHECALDGETVVAVATCRHCGVGLCIEHLQAAQSYRAGGTLYGCPHDLTAKPRLAMPVRARTNGHVRVPAGVE